MVSPDCHDARVHHPTATASQAEKTDAAPAAAVVEDDEEIELPPAEVDDAAARVAAMKAAFKAANPNAAANIAANAAAAKAEREAADAAEADGASNSASSSAGAEESWEEEPDEAKKAEGTAEEGNWDDEPTDKEKKEGEAAAESGFKFEMPDPDKLKESVTMAANEHWSKRGEYVRAVFPSSRHLNIASALRIAPAPPF